MGQKKSVFDIVFVKGPESIFEFRFKENYDFVDYFIIFGTEKNFGEIRKYINDSDPKLVTIVLNESFDFDSIDIEFVSNSILEIIERYYTSFDDLVFFSLSNEIPSIEPLTDYEIKSKEVNVLMSVVYEINFNRKRKFSEVSSILTNFSFLLKNKKSFLSDVFNLKLKKLSEDTSILNGYKILNYQESPSNLPSTYECHVSKKQIEYKFKKVVRKFVFLFYSSKKKISGDHIFHVQFKPEFPENFSIDLSKNEHNMTLYIPQVVLYGENLKKFQENYKKNEIMRILSVFDCNNEDEIEIHLNKKNKKNLKFSEIKNPSF